jgi:uncharacterized membrane protein
MNKIFLRSRNKMKKLFNISANLKSDRGATAVYVAIMLVVFIGMAALAVDVGYLMVARNESQNAADAAALAGARRLGENYYIPISPVTTDVITVAQNTAAQNKVAGLNLSATAGDNVVTKIGTWDSTRTPRFVETATGPDAVQVETRRQGGTTSGAIGTFFAPIFKLIDPASPDTVNVGATACAAISGICTATPGIPLGIGKSWFTHIAANRGCTQIAVNDTTQSCAGWTNLSTDKFKQQQVQDMLTGKTPMPTLHSGDRAEFGNGTVTPVLTDLDNLFRDKIKYRDQKTFDAAGNVLTWTTSVVVYDDGNVCIAPNAEYTIIGFATITITDVITTGNDKGPVGVINCNLAKEVRGSCFYAGTYGTIPGLVQ